MRAVSGLADRGTARATSLVLAAGLAASLAGPASAKDCNGEHMSQADMNACFGEDFRKADALLNARYKKIVGCLKDKARQLVEAQRAWIKFRHNECAFQGASLEGGSFQPSAIAICLTSLTEERNKRLEYYVTCKEGDLTCPTIGCEFGVGGK